MKLLHTLFCIPRMNIVSTKFAEFSNNKTAKMVNALCCWHSLLTYR